MRNLNVGNRRARHGRRHAMRQIVCGFNAALQAGDFIPHRISCDRGVVTDLDGIAVELDDQGLVMQGASWKVTKKAVLPSQNGSRHICPRTSSCDRLWINGRPTRPDHAHRLLAWFIDRVRLEDNEIRGVCYA